MEYKKQLDSIDYFKIIAAFMVIAIHTSPLSSFDYNIDFLLTRIIARVAVPFFCMVTGYFLLPEYLFNKSTNPKPLLAYNKKILFLYTITSIIYLPINFYTGNFTNIKLSTVLRAIFFDGTFYHLWYFPATLLGTLLVYLITRKFSVFASIFIAIVLYLIGLLGDSYYGFIIKFHNLQIAYDFLFNISSYTRNGVFYIPIFLIIGAVLNHSYRQYSNYFLLVGLIISLTLMITEGLVLHRFNIQRHDSMYIFLLPCMFFLFQLILAIKVYPKKSLRTISMLIYIFHPLFIIIVRGIAKIFHMESIFIYNSLIHFITVTILTSIFAIILTFLNTNFHELIFAQKFAQKRAWIELDYNNLKNNIIALQNILPDKCKLMPAVKADAYGHSGVLVSKALNTIGIKSFCVATLSEGILLRRKGVKGEILILGYTHPKQFRLLKRYHLIQTVLDYQYAELLNSYGKKLKVHIKIDTGMHRLGERHEHINAICAIFNCKNLIITGIYTHLCSDETVSHIDREFTFNQARVFQDVITQIKKLGFSCPKVHLQASYGVLNYPELSGDYARIGIALYGVLSMRTHLKTCPTKLHPVLSIKSRIALVKDLYMGETAGYGLQYITKHTFLLF